MNTGSGGSFLTPGLATQFQGCNVLSSADFCERMGPTVEADTSTSTMLRHFRPGRMTMDAEEILKNLVYLKETMLEIRH